VWAGLRGGRKFAQHLAELVDAGHFVIATSPTGEDVVYLEGQLHGQVIDRAEYLRQMVEVWESIRGEALSQQQSLELMAEVAETWT
jgi:hypothetical protein